MNVQLTTVLSDLSGRTDVKIIRAIVGGERDGKKLAEFRDPNVKASKEAIANSLEGTWLPEQLAIVGRQLADWDHMQQQMAGWDKELAALLKEMPTAEVNRWRRRRGRWGRKPTDFRHNGELKRIAGVDPD